MLQHFSRCRHRSVSRLGWETGVSKAAATLLYSSCYSRLLVDVRGGVEKQLQLWLFLSVFHSWELCFTAAASYSSCCSCWTVKNYERESRDKSTLSFKLLQVSVVLLVEKRSAGGGPEQQVALFKLLQLSLFLSLVRSSSVSQQLYLFQLLQLSVCLPVGMGSGISDWRTVGKVF
jgi:hypothetical protein